MMEQNTNWNLGVGGAVLRGREILLVRHTYGGAKGKLLIPGGHLHIGEMPEAAVVREIYEETGITATVKKFIGIRFKKENWYAIFLLDYVSGEPKCDGIEVDFAGFVPIDEAAKMDDLPDLSRIIIESILSGATDLPLNDYFPGSNRNEYMLYIGRKAL